jgi:hypothetical protein
LRTDNEHQEEYENSGGSSGDLVCDFLCFCASEVAYRFQRDRIARQPETIELVIPLGTADRVAAGDPVPTIPDEMDFLLGDTLLVINQDQVDHQLGPIWVPPGSSAQLSLDEPEKYSYSCSFQPSRFLGINVRPPTTLLTRLTGLALAVPPTTMVFFLYGFLVFPPGGKKENDTSPPVAVT